MAFVRKYWMWLLVAGLIVLVLVINKDSLFPAQEKAPSQPGSGKGNVPVGSASPGGGSTGITATGLDADMPLKKGVEGPEVTELQHLLNAADASDLIPEDGIFGPKTEAKLVRLTFSASTTLTQAWTYFSSVEKKAWLDKLLGFTTL